MKKFLVAFLVSFLFLPLAHAKPYDPCDQITGRWSGNWYSDAPYECSWYVKGESFRNGKNIYFNFIGYSDNCLNQPFAMTGTCERGKVLLSNSNAVMTGFVAHNELKISGNHQYARLIRN